MTVRLDPRALREWPWLPAEAAVGTVWLGPCGERVLVRDDGTAEALLPGGYPRSGPAGDPCAGRTSPVSTRSNRNGE